MRACKCPNCGANLNFDETPNNYVFCQYCGTKIDLLDQRTMHTEHIIDDAKIKESEAKMKNAESMSRIVNIFAAPVEEKQRQAEFERQRQLEAERREYERQERKEAERRADREAMADGCAAVMGKLLAKCVKHPFIALLILCALFGSIKPATAKNQIVSSSTSTSTTSTVSTELTGRLSSKTMLLTYSYDSAYFRTGAEESHHYYLIDHADKILCAINEYSKAAYILHIKSDDYENGIEFTMDSLTTIAKSSDLAKNLSITYIDEDGTSGPYDFEIVSIDSALSHLDNIEKVYEYR